MTDLPSAQEIVEKNEVATGSTRAFNSRTNFLELDWEEKLPDHAVAPELPVALVVASDCTYNADSRYVF